MITSLSSKHVEPARLASTILVFSWDKVFLILWALLQWLEMLSNVSWCLRKIANSYFVDFICPRVLWSFYKANSPPPPAHLPKHSHFLLQPWSTFCCNLDQQLYNGSLAWNIATFCCNPDQRSSNIPNWWLGFVSSKVWVWESNFISFNNKKGMVSLVEPQLNLLLLQVFTALKFSFLRTLQREDRVTGFSRFQELRPALQS